MSAASVPEAWIRILQEEDIPVDLPNPYNFGFRAAMGRLVATHDRIGPAFGRLYRQIMFEPGRLSRQERELVAGVAAAAQDCYY
jgi:alkylhydroperoxidase/carboxymuconolactone decarboxylase family protein YurZ